MLLEDSPGSRSPVGLRGQHFPIFDRFIDTSFATRYELFCQLLVRERLYDSACFLLSDSARGLEGEYTEPNPELGFTAFATSLTAHAMAHARMREQ